MIYSEFNGLEIVSRLGVSPVGEDTLMIARGVASLPVNRVLEVGAGTGFVALYLALLGRKCEGIDVSPEAVECCRANAAANNLDVSFYQSDLFDKVSGQYDLIVFNPPYGHSRPGRWSRVLDIIKSMLPKENRLLSALVYRVIRKDRRRLIRRFLHASREYLCEGGSLVIVLRHNELDLLAGEALEILGDFNQQQLVRWHPVCS
jgi:methylase of polypeptide subunit release factors